MLGGLSRRAGTGSVLLGVLCGACAGQRSVPEGISALPPIAGPVIGDGRSAATAWTGARRAQLGEAVVQLGRVPAGVAVRVESARPSIATVLVASGDRVWLLHVSAALGTGEYRCGPDGRCTRTRDFEWSCRDPSDRPEAVACREAFRAREGWIGNVAPEGGTVRELVIAPERFGVGDLRLVVTVLVLPDLAQSWPPVTDEAASPGIQQGALPDAARFAPGTWLEVRR